MSHITKHIFAKKSGNCILPLLMIFIILAVIAPMDINLSFEYFMNYMIYIGLPQSIFLPLIIITVKRLRPIKRNVGKAAIVTILLLISACGLSGCAKQTEIEERDFVQVFGVDYMNGQFLAYYALPDLAAESEQPSNDTEK